MGVKEFASSVHAQSYHQLTLQVGSIIKLGSYSFVQLDSIGTLMALESVFLCPLGSYVDNGTCQLCSTGLNNCTACASPTKCHSCELGYHLENFICIPDCNEVTNCNSCDSPNHCSPTGCSTGYYTNTTTGQCDTCSSLDSNCLTCDSTTTSSSAICNTCTTGYYPNGSTCSTCANTLSHCSSCSNSSTCLTCELGYHLDLVTSACIPDCSVGNCNTCSGPNYCSDTPGSCSSGYYADNGGCLDCATAITGCSECSDASTCTTCRPGYILETNGTCTPTGSVPDCSVYSDPDICSSCNLGYYLDTNACLNCNTSISNCATCNYASASATLTCDSCTSGYSLDSSTNTCIMDCSPTGGNCNSCTTPNYCSPTGCSSGYYNTGGTCTNCSSTLSHCTSCTDGTTCNTCETGYHVDLTTNTCVLDCNPAGGNCNTCDSPDHCAPTGCAPGYTTNPTTGTCTMNCSVANCASTSSCYGPDQCGTCSTGHYPNLTNGQCNACTGLHPDCLTCTDSSTCTACGGASYLNGTSCESCSTTITGCTSCTNSSTCTTCATGYNLIGDACVPTGTDPNCNVYTAPGVCSPLGCGGGYYNNSGTCASCTTGCSDCNDGSSCNSCTTGYYLTGSGPGSSCTACSTVSTGCTACSDSSACTACETGYNLVGGLCVPTGTTPNCSAYSAPNQCSTCSTGYYLDSNACGDCTTSLTSDCLACSSANTCTSCDIGTILDSGECFACSVAINNCSSCDGAACTSCASGHYLSAGFCPTCSSTNTGCSECLDSTTCTICEGGYNLVAGSCVPTGSVTNCTTYTTPGECSACATGYTLNTGTNTCEMNCNPTGGHCLTCETPNHCSPTGCANGYFSNSGICAPCASTIPGCTACIDGTTCTTCDTNYVLDDNICRHLPGTPTNLTLPPTIYNAQTITISWNAPANATGYILERSCNGSAWNQIYQGASPSATNNLDDCDGPVQYRVKAYNTLVTIESGYTISIPKDYAACSGNCTACSDANTCISCTTDYHLDGGTCVMDCSPAGGNCNSCTAPNYCAPTGCDSNYYFDNGICSACGTALTGCAECSGSSTCTTCGTGYNLVSGVCIPTGTTPNCAAYSAPDQCSTCETGYYLNTNACPACSDTLTTNCLTCTSAGHCTSCTTGTILTTGSCASCSTAVTNCDSCDGTACTGCASGYFLDNGTCPLCSTAITGCNECSNSSTCTSCQPGYILEANGTCTPTGSITNCTTYDSPGQCSTCDSGYTLNTTTNSCDMNCNPTGGNCNTCDSPDHCGPTGCASGYFSNSGVCATCASTIPGCTTCSSGATCTACDTDAGYVLDGATCRPTPAAPANLTLPTTIYNAQTITITWDPATNATGYILERSCNSGEWNSIYQGASPSASNNLADCDGPVQYRVKAYNTLVTIVSDYTISSLHSYTACGVSSCDKCSDASTCTTCTTGYIVNGNACVPTGSVANCATYSQPEVCSTCESGYHLITNACWSTAPGGANGMNMQDFTADYCDGFTAPAPLGYTLVGTLTDTRDSKSYEVRKFADGKCWMADNLAYGGDTIGGGSDECDGKTTFDPCGDGSAAVGGRDCSDGASKAGSAWGYGDCHDPSVGSSYCSTGEGAGKCGYLYNWQAAIQLPDAYYRDVFSHPHGAPSATNFYQGICPAGWHLPSGYSSGIASSEFGLLDQANGGNGAISYFPGHPNANPEVIYSFWLAGHVFKGLYTGYAKSGGYVAGQGEYMSIWSANNEGNSGKYIQYMLYEGPDGWGAGMTSTLYPWGRSVRCLKNTNDCSANCNSCTSATSCNQCDDGYGLANGFCVHTGPVANCSTYSDPTTCSKCVGGYVLTGNTCVPTGNVANCSAYSAPEQCSTCNTGYYLNANTCLAIPPAPTNLTIPTTIYNAQTITINWDTSTNATGYILERSCNSSEWNSIYQGASPSATNSLADCEQPVQYRVKAFNTLATIASPYTNSTPQDYAACSGNCTACSAADTCAVCNSGHSLVNGACVVDCANPDSIVGTMQTFTVSNCDSYATPSATNYTPIGCLTDERDGKAYEIRKFADGNCWMADNLAYGGDTTAGATDECDGKTTFDGCGDGSGVLDCGVGGGASKAGSAWGYGDCRDPKALGEDEIAGANSYCATGEGAGKCGYLYNWQAAVQLPGAYDGGIVSYPNGIPSTINFHQGICPAGWHLPSGDWFARADSEFSQLHLANGGDDSFFNAVYPPAMPGACGKSSTSAACNFWHPGYAYKSVFVGHALQNGYLVDQGIGIRQWSASENFSEGTAWYLVIANNEDWQGGWGMNSWGRPHGFTVRCLKNNTDCPANCASCSSATSCNQCSEGYTVSGGVCIPTGNVANCSAYSAPNVCATCNSGYLKSGATCVSAGSVVTGCTASNGSACTSCSGGRYLSSGSCPTCPTGCATCTSASSCQACSSGYILISGTCMSQLAANSKNGTNMQDLTTTDCARFAKPAATGYTLVGTLRDSRDGKYYEIRKFADGKCWMVDNLKYGGTTDACASKTSFSGNGSAAPTNRFGSGTYGDCRNNPGSPTYGYLYNWQAAMQHASAYYNATYIGPTSNVQGICPPGWHLPIGGSAGEFQALHSIAGLLATGFWQGGVWKGVYSGYCDGSGSLSRQGISGFYWSSSQSSTVTYAYFLSFGSDSVQPAPHNDKNRGYPIRCIKN